MPPGTFSGTDVSMKLYLWFFAQCSDSAFKSQSSPIDIPIPAIKR